MENEAYLISVFLFGLLFGSFLNVCIYRLPRSGMSIVKPSSHCPKCNHPIRWFDNIPVLSYLLLLGKCRYCKTPISLRYPLVELLTALLITFAFDRHFFSSSIVLVDFLTKENIAGFLISFYLISSLIIVTFIDFEFRIIPNEITMPGIFIAFIISLIIPEAFEPLFPVQSPSLFASALSVVAGAIAGGGIVYLVGVLGKLIFRKEAMGFGDVKLMAMLGGFLGYESIIYVFFLGCFFGAIVGILSYLVTKEHYLAFGPYLALGALVMLFFKPEIVVFATQIYPEFIRNLLTR